MSYSLNHIDSCLAVFQGGGCKAIAYIGAYEEAKNRGIVFSEVAGTSAGSIIAALIAANATPQQMKDFVNKINFKKLTKPNIKHVFRSFIAFVLLTFISSFIIYFIHFPYAWIIPLVFLVVAIGLLFGLIIPFKYWYGYNSMNKLQKLLEDELQKLLAKQDKDVVRFKDLYIPISIVSANIEGRKEEIFTTRDSGDKSVAEAVCASCAIPFFFQPVFKKNVDGGLVSNSPIHLFAHRPSYHRILSFQLQEINNNSTNTNKFKDFVEQLISTIIDGAVTVQSSFGIQVNKIIIPIQDISATDFEKVNQKSIEKLIKIGKKVTNQEMDKIQKSDLSSLHSNALNDKLTSFDEMYSLIATYSCEKVTEVVISAPDTEWAWHLFPTLMKWVTDEAKIDVYYINSVQNRKTKRKDEDARLKLLDSLGCKTISLKKEELDARAFFIKSTSQWRGVIYDEKFDEKKGYYVFDVGCYYDYKLDSTAMSAWVRKIREQNTESHPIYNGNISLCKENEDAIIQPIRDYCSMYKDANLQYTVLSRRQMERLLFLTDRIRLYKYRQIDYLFTLYHNSNIDYFSPAKILMPSDTDSVIGPIVVEKENENEYVIEGHTRLLYAYMHNIDKIHVLYVEGASIPISKPTNYVPRHIGNLIIVDDKPHSDLPDSKYRHIEAAIENIRGVLPEQV